MRDGYGSRPIETAYGDEMKRGRKTKRTPKLVKQICALLRDGISISSTCAAVGIAESRYFDWVNKFRDFREKTTRARANGKVTLLRSILSDKDWRAKAWYLERCWPQEFGRTIERQLPQEPTQPREITSVKVMVADGIEADRVIERLARDCTFPVINDASPQPEISDEETLAANSGTDSCCHGP